MKPKALLYFALLACNALSSQQNFFNVPNSEITEAKKVFFQQQFNLFFYRLQSNTTIDYGLGKGFEIGLNYNGFTLAKDRSLHLVFDGQNKPYTPYLMLNAQKRFDIKDNIAVAVGGQIGSATTSRFRLGGYAFSNFIYSDHKFGLNTVAGLYYATNSYFGRGDRFFNNYIGLQIGLEKSIVRDKFVAQIDFFSGRHNVGEVVMGGAYYITPNWILSAGYQLPTFKSASVNSFVVELTYSPNKKESVKKIPGHNKA